MTLFLCSLRFLLFQLIGHTKKSQRVVLGHLATACCRRRRLPPDRWWPLAVTGGSSSVGGVFLKRVDVFSI